MKTVINLKFWIQKNSSSNKLLKHEFNRIANRYDKQGKYQLTVHDIATVKSMLKNTKEKISFKRWLNDDTDNSSVTKIPRNSSHPKKKLFIITAGPPGSGKSDIPHIYFDLKPPDNNVDYGNKDEIVSILVDNLVETDPQYKSDVKNIGDNYCLSNMSKCVEIEMDEKDQQKIKKIKKKCLVESVKAIFDTPTIELQEEFNIAYTNCRYFRNPIKQPKQNCCGKYDNCDTQNNFDMAKALHDHKHIVLETNLRSIPNWIWTSTQKTASGVEFNMGEILKNNYQVVVIGTLVNMDTLIQRNKSRASQMVCDFLTDKSDHAPRLPDISRSAYKTQCELYKINFTRMCKDHNWLNNCRIHLLDNNVRPDGQRLPQLYLDVNQPESKSLQYSYTIQSGERREFVLKSHKVAAELMETRMHV